VSWRVCALALPLAACQLGGVPPAELSSDPIAFSYRTPEDARRRADAFDEQVEARTREAAPEGPTYVGSHAQIQADVNQLGSFLESAFGTDHRDERFPGRLALLDPASGEVTIVEGALRGSLPLAWSPDHERLLYAQPLPGAKEVQLFEFDRTRKTVRAVTHGPLSHSQGCYGPERRIVVTAVDLSTQPPRTRIRASQPGGRGPFVDLSEGPVDHSPTCVPALDSLVFARSLPNHRFEVVAQSPIVGGTPRVLSPGRQPSLTRDGSWILFSGPHGRGWSLWRIRPDGSGRAPVGASERDELQPAASPDGRFVVYSSSETPPRVHLYLRRFDGSGDRILFADGDGEYPIW
jgi:WD40-like Beta Propeller Repeat